MASEALLRQMVDAVVEHEEGHEIEVDRNAVLRYLDIALTDAETTGAVLLDRHEVAAMRRSLEWVQSVIAATASRNADLRYLETLGLLGRIGEPNDGDADERPVAETAAGGDH